MRTRVLALFLSPLLALAACDAKPAAAAGNGNATVATAATDLTTLLAGINDAATAEKAKPQLDALTTQLDQGIAALKSIATGSSGASSGTSNGATGGTDFGKLAGDLASQAAGLLSPELKDSFAGITKEIDRLLQDPQIKAVVGTGLEKLQGLVKG